MLMRQRYVPDHLANGLFFVANYLIVEAEQLDASQNKRAQKQMQALVYLHLVLNYASTWQAIKDRAAHLQTQLLAELTPEIIATASGHAETQTLEQAVEKFLEEFTISN
jgi:hypothetical protein